MLKLEIRAPRPEVRLVLLSPWTLPAGAVSPGHTASACIPSAEEGRGQTVGRGSAAPADYM